MITTIVRVNCLVMFMCFYTKQGPVAKMQQALLLRGIHWQVNCAQSLKFWNIHEIIVDVA